MARFLKHISCPFCGSKDNRGVYDDGSEWCFGGGKSCSPKGGTMSPLVAKLKHGNDSNGPKLLPSDASTHFGAAALTWLERYGIDIPTLIARGVRWSEERQQLLFTFGEFWQARNFREGKSKYFTSGPHDDLLPIYPVGGGRVGLGNGPGTTLVMTEDCLSAIKVVSSCRPDTAPAGLEGRWCDAMPLLGTNLPTSKLMRLNRLYSNVVVWLDHDKAKEAMSIAQRCKLVGMTAKVVITEHDPKDFSFDEIHKILTPTT